MHSTISSCLYVLCYKRTEIWQSKPSIASTLLQALTSIKGRLCFFEAATVMKYAGDDVRWTFVGQNDKMML